MTGITRSNIRKTTIAAVALAGAATVLLAGAKPAAGAIVTSTVSVPQSGFVSTTATCPEGQRAYSAGFESTARVPGSVQVLPQESRKIGQRGWILTVARSDANPANATTTLILYCFKWAPKTKEALTVTASPDDFGEFDTADAVCPPGRTVQAGGFSIPVTADFRIFGELIEFYRVAEDTWRARMSGTRGGQLATYAYCAKRKPPTEAAGTARSTQPGASFTSVTAPCPRKRKAVAGGINQPDASPQNGWVFGYFRFLRVGRSWETSATDLGAPSTLNTFVYCAKKPPDKNGKKG